MLFKKKKLTSEDLKKIPKSFDVIGGILIFTDFPKELKSKEKLVGNYLLNKFKNIITVTKKTKKYSGKLRTAKLKIIAGEKNKETIHAESGIKLKVNPEKVYFSPRSGTERLRIAKLVKKGEDILVMFSGIAPFPLVISKHSNANEIYAIELNKQGHKYAKENIKLNKIKNIVAIQGDVRKKIPNKKFDRIIMPLPKDAENYLSLALKNLKPTGTIHLYTFEKQENFNKLKEKYKKYNIKLIKAGTPAPRKYRVCLDLSLK
ncbi:methyltransferase [Candidatus Woesearchaeota archaeon]|jgi:tRNA (guanine37-N1)-methyltransferase|nr:methyltransferase [Candidatus Woesearchaeota archaeon]MBT4834992.1 methyltransferase [Candidatus Woesearchaeota archaeon]MBT6735084.1 methyltransferase [Candidatus Woesearchaeota archaeon]MBT7169437.1 methyltransferase [Candidatus Woesearchaeota archaeon]MBT7474750.1 methyltransferase [Candidatus Woesearchaeota archaeon]